MFSASTPTSPEGFFNRARELARLEDSVDKLQRGAPKWLCLFGPRKVGKTSLLREAERRTRARARAPGFVVVDVFETLPVSLEVFRHIAVQAIEVLLSRDAGRSLAAEFDVPAALRVMSLVALAGMLAFLAIALALVSGRFRPLTWALAVLDRWSFAPAALRDKPSAWQEFWGLRSRPGLLHAMTPSITYRTRPRAG